MPAWINSSTSVRIPLPPSGNKITDPNFGTDYYMNNSICSLLAHFQADAEEFLKVATEVNAASPAKVDELDAELMKMFAYNAQGDICPIQAFIGGITAQEVMKVGYFSDTEMGLEVVSKCFVV